MYRRENSKKRYFCNNVIWLTPSFVETWRKLFATTENLVSIMEVKKFAHLSHLVIPKKYFLQLSLLKTTDSVRTFSHGTIASPGRYSRNALFMTASSFQIFPPESSYLEWPFCNSLTTSIPRFLSPCNHVCTHYRYSPKHLRSFQNIFHNFLYTIFKLISTL